MHRLLYSLFWVDTSSAFGVAFALFWTAAFMAMLVAAGIGIKMLVANVASEDAGNTAGIAFLFISFIAYGETSKRIDRTRWGERESRQQRYRFWRREK